MCGTLTTQRKVTLRAEGVHCARAGSSEEHQVHVCAGNECNDVEGHVEICSVDNCGVGGGNCGVRHAHGVKRRHPVSLDLILRLSNLLLRHGRATSCLGEVGLQTCNWGWGANVVSERARLTHPWLCRLTKMAMVCMCRTPLVDAGKAEAVFVDMGSRCWPMLANTGQC